MFWQGKRAEEAAMISLTTRCKKNNCQQDAAEAELPRSRRLI
jgi:hypothetical protein